MNPSKFFSLLAILSIVVFILLWLLHLNVALQPYQSFSWLSCTFFIFLSIIMYSSAVMASKSKSVHTFTNVSLGFMMLKMMFSAIIILFYNKLMKPDSIVFLIPFFLIYLFYTIFETYFMIKLGKNERNI